MNKIKKIAVGSIVVSMLIGAASANAAPSQDGAKSFTDVNSSFWGYPAIMWGVKQNITSGYEDGSFKPNKTVTEAEFLALLIRAFGDVPSTGGEQSWSDKYYDFAKKNNMPVSGKRDATITRLTVAEIIVGTQGVNLLKDDAVQYMLDKGLTKGKTAATVEGYAGQDTLTRAEAITFIKNVMDHVENKVILPRPAAASPAAEQPSAAVQEPLIPVYAAGSFGGTLIVTESGQLWQWGTMFGYDDNRTKVLQDVQNVYSGQSHYLALKKDHTLWAWGKNAYGEVGNGTVEGVKAPVQILSDVKNVSGGPDHSFALMNDGTVKAWGANEQGQLGDGTQVNRSTPVTIANLKQVVAVTGERYDSLALLQDGTVWAWGSRSGQAVPTQLSEISDVVSIFSGNTHSLALKKDGTVWAIGFNDKGQLGDGTNEYRSSFVQVADLTDVIAISGGEKHSLALKKDGTVWAWGDNNVGQLGNGAKIDKKAVPFIASTPESENKNRPVRVPNLTNIVKLGGRFNHNFALDEEGKLWSWGYNNSGQLGDGTKDNQSAPVQVKLELP